MDSSSRTDLFDFDAYGLLHDPRFESYFSDESSPLVQEIRSLEKQIMDPTITDHIRILQAKFKLLGILQVTRTLEALARKQAEPTPPQRTEPGSRFLRTRIGVG